MNKMFEKKTKDELTFHVVEKNVTETRLSTKTIIGSIHSSPFFLFVSSGMYRTRAGIAKKKSARYSSKYTIAFAKLQDINVEYKINGSIR